MCYSQETPKDYNYGNMWWWTSHSFWIKWDTGKKEWGIQRAKSLLRSRKCSFLISCLINFRKDSNFILIPIFNQFTGTIGAFISIRSSPNRGSSTLWNDVRNHLLKANCNVKILQIVLIMITTYGTFITSEHLPQQLYWGIDKISMVYWMLTVTVANDKFPLWWGEDNDKWMTGV